MGDWRAMKSIAVSIHAPAKGATEISIITQDYLTTFQSTLPRRERQLQCRMMLSQNRFNPRSREGSDLVHPRHILLCLCFNPRSREGSDCECKCDYQCLRCFNPRSREGSDFPAIIRTHIC